MIKVVESDLNLNKCEVIGTADTHTRNTRGWPLGCWSSSWQPEQLLGALVSTSRPTLLARLLLPSQGRPRPQLQSPGGPLTISCGSRSVHHRLARGANGRSKSCSFKVTLFYCHRCRTHSSPITAATSPFSFTVPSQKRLQLVSPLYPSRFLHPPFRGLVKWTQ